MTNLDVRAVDGGGKELVHATSTLRLRFLTPLVAAIVLLTLLLTVSLFYFESERQSFAMIHERLARTQAVTNEFYEKSVESDVRAIKSILAALRMDEKLNAIFASQDRTALLSYSDGLFQELKREYGISHFYFNSAERVNILRVHAPERYGDRIDRITTLWAEKRKSVVHGVELGVLGTLTLRVVAPWYDPHSGALIGFLELGMEVDHVLQRIRDMFGFDVAVIVHKEYLERDKWTDGMKVLGRAGNWDEFSTVVLSSDAGHEPPGVLRDYLQKGSRFIRNDVQRLQHTDSVQWLMSLPIQDAMGHDVAAMVLLADASSESTLMQQSVLIVGLVVLLIGSLLVGFFYWQTGMLGKRIESDERLLKELVTHDGLTGLLSRRMFHQVLGQEMAHSSRFDHPLSLLMVDIDFFKAVNDTYGHPAGDEVLREVSGRIRQAVREVDSVCRYGGEEIAVILPETDVNGATELAERLMATVSGASYKIDGGRTISITVSIGVSSYPLHGDTDIFLISAADKALYAAKRGGRNRVVVSTEELTTEATPPSPVPPAGA